jgi:hypothetical protein
MEFPMTQLQARAVENARKEYRRAQNELRVHRLSETRYRGIPTIKATASKERHGCFTYRGVSYCH